MKKFSILKEIEWLTLGLIVFCTAALLVLTALFVLLPFWVSLPLIIVFIALHSSLQHEVLHGHPFQNKLLNEALVFVPFGLFIPYKRFRDTHIQHHFDPNLTDPYDDPESNFLDPVVWEKTAPVLRLILTLNNSLAGRMVLGPAIGLFSFYKSDFRSIAKGNWPIFKAYLCHFSGLIVLAYWLISIGTIPAWAYVTAAYAGNSLLKIRTFLEHRAHKLCDARTVIIEDRGFFALLFLNNNFHAVHHAYPKLAWYKIPRAYQEDRQTYLDQNCGYSFANYGVIFRKYFFHNKDKVPHPLWSSKDRQ